MLNPKGDPMFQEFTAQYLSVAGGLSGTTASVQSATLIDNDLFRDNPR
jgi:hypothetical protein